jgi:hypothetical protein
MKNVLVCAVQTPYIRGGARSWSRTCATPGLARLPGGRGERPLPRLPTLRDRSSNPRLTSPRRHGELKKESRPRHPHQVPELAGQPPAQGAVAVPPAPRGLRPPRVAVLRVLRERRGPPGGGGDTAMDAAGLKKCRTRFAISRNVTSRLAQWSGLEAETLYPRRGTAATARKATATTPSRGRLSRWAGDLPGRSPGPAACA